MTKFKVECWMTHEINFAHLQLQSQQTEKEPAVERGSRFKKYRDARNFSNVDSREMADTL